MRNFLILLLLFSLCVLQLPAQATRRSIDEIFPELPAPVRTAIFSKDGYSRSSRLEPSSSFIGSGHSAIDPLIIESIYSKQPGFLVESIIVVPDSSHDYTLLDVYNALGKTRELKGRLYNSHSRHEPTPLFEDVTRIQSAKKNVPIPDPSPASSIPLSETIFMRLKDVNFGDSFYRGDMTLTRQGTSDNSAIGMHYSLSNNRNITYYLIPVIKEEKFNARFYFEPIAEGILIYGLAGADVSDFVSSRIDMKSAISKRLAVIVGWIVNGITRK